jgi:cytidine deaminase
MSVAGEGNVQPTPDPELLRAAKDASHRAYAPYSHFYVGCAVRSVSGAIYSGCNVENESFPAGVCAERAAVAAAIAREGPQPEIMDILVYALGSDRQHTACAPCGICRQVIYECAPRATVGFFIADGEYIEVGAVDLLPHAFRGHLK